MNSSWPTEYVLDIDLMSASLAVRNATAPIMQAIAGSACSAEEVMGVMILAKRVRSVAFGAFELRGVARCGGYQSR